MSSRGLLIAVGLVAFALIGCNKGGQASDAPPDPAPKPTSKVQSATTLDKMRDSLKTLTEKDQVQFAVGSVSRGDEGMSLSVQVKNASPCEVVAVEGVAYGFDAEGKAARMNKGGEPYVGFAKEGLKIPPNGKEKIELPLKHPDSASVAVGQIDSYRCADGKTWLRP